MVGMARPVPDFVLRPSRLRSRSRRRTRYGRCGICPVRTAEVWTSSPDTPPRRTIPVLFCTPADVCRSSYIPPSGRSSMLRGPCPGPNDITAAPALLAERPRAPHCRQRDARQGLPQALRRHGDSRSFCEVVWFNFGHRCSPPRPRCPWRCGRNGHAVYGARLPRTRRTPPFVRHGYCLL